MSTTVGRPISQAEAAQYLADDTPLDEMWTSAKQDVHPMTKVTDRIVLYHPDAKNPVSTYIVPVEANDRRFVMMNLLSKTKMVNGREVRWNFLQPQVEPQELPLRCFVSNCMRAGGFATRADLIAHVNGKHTNEAPLYQVLIDRLMELVHRDIPADQYEALGLEPPKAEGKKASNG